LARPKEFDRDIALRQAMAVFWAKGYEGTSVSNLTEAMGISRSSLYETFGDKQDLFREALTFYTEFTGRKRAAVLAGAASVKDGMAAFFAGVINFLLSEEYPEGCFFTNTATALGTLNEQICETIRLGTEGMEEDFFRFFARGQQRGELAGDRDIRAFARFCVSLVRGISVMARVQKDRKALEDIVKVGLEALV
jgi:TetR/AcrR family transcriptional regulator, transcriptional repressor for nem operon